MLLVVVAPLVSRAIAHPAADTVQAHDAHTGHHRTEMEQAPQVDEHHVHQRMEHGTHHSMPMMPPAEEAEVRGTAPSKSSDPHAEHEMGVDCDYCLIAARMISLLVALLLFLTAWPAVFRALAGLVDTRRAPALGTLGARGPPAALAC